MIMINPTRKNPVAIKAGHNSTPSNWISKKVIYQYSKTKTETESTLPCFPRPFHHNNFASKHHLTKAIASEGALMDHIAASKLTVPPSTRKRAKKKILFQGKQDCAHDCRVVSNLFVHALSVECRSNAVSDTGSGHIKLLIPQIFY